MLRLHLSCRVSELKNCCNFDFFLSLKNRTCPWAKEFFTKDGYLSSSLLSSKKSSEVFLWLLLAGGGVMYIHNSAEVIVALCCLAWIFTYIRCKAYGSRAWLLCFSSLQDRNIALPSRSSRSTAQLPFKYYITTCPPHLTITSTRKRATPTRAPSATPSFSLTQTCPFLTKATSATLSEAQVEDLSCILYLVIRFTKLRDVRSYLFCRSSLFRRIHHR